MTVTSAPMPAPPANSVMRYVISPTRLDSSDAFLFHKTTRRELYDQEWKHYSDTLGADEVIYLNERGELAEGSGPTFRGPWRWHSGVTPPLPSGLLPGVLRAELLGTGKAVEGVLSAEELATAKSVYLGNSVRGLLKALRSAEIKSAILASRRANAGRTGRDFRGLTRHQKHDDRSHRDCAGEQYLARKLAHAAAEREVREWVFIQSRMQGRLVFRHSPVCRATVAHRCACLKANIDQ